MLPTPLSNPKIVSISNALKLLDIDKEQLIESHNELTPKLVDILIGNAILNQSKPIAHNYSGNGFTQKLIIFLKDINLDHLRDNWATEEQLVSEIF